MVQVFPSNTNHLHSVMWFQIFQAIIRFQVINAINYFENNYHHHLDLLIAWILLTLSLIIHLYCQPLLVGSPSSVRTPLMNIGFCWSANTGMYLRENFAYMFVSASPARRTEFKSWTKLFTFYKALIPFGKVWIQLISLQLWINCRADWVL